MSSWFGLSHPLMSVQRCSKKTRHQFPEGSELSPPAQWTCKNRRIVISSQEENKQNWERDHLLCSWLGNVLEEFLCCNSCLGFSLDLQRWAVFDPFLHSPSWGFLRIYQVLDFHPRTTAWECFSDVPVEEKLLDRLLVPLWVEFGCDEHESEGTDGPRHGAAADNIINCYIKGRCRHCSQTVVCFLGFLFFLLILGFLSSTELAWGSDKGSWLLVNEPHVPFFPFLERAFNDKNLQSILKLTTKI